MPRRHRLFYGLAFGIALMMTALFTVRAVHRFSHLRSGAGEPIRPWMNVPYIAHAYGVPPEILFDTLGITPENETRRPRPIGAKGTRMLVGKRRVNRWPIAGEPTVVSVAKPRVGCLGN